MKCPYCGSKRIELGVSWGYAGEGGKCRLEI